MLAGVTYQKSRTKVYGSSKMGKANYLRLTTLLFVPQVPQRELQQQLEQAGMQVHLIGGADVAAELDAKRAIRQGAELAAKI